MMDPNRMFHWSHVCDQQIRSWETTVQPVSLNRKREKEQKNARVRRAYDKEDGDSRGEIRNVLLYNEFSCDLKGKGYEPRIGEATAGNGHR